MESVKIRKKSQTAKSECPTIIETGHPNNTVNNSNNSTVT